MYGIPVVTATQHCVLAMVHCPALICSPLKQPEAVDRQTPPSDEQAKMETQ